MYLHFCSAEKNKLFEKACEGRVVDLPVSHLLHQDGINISVYHTQ